MSDIAISVNKISKRYEVFDNQRSRVFHALWPSHIKSMQEIWALQDVSFEIKRGEAVAIIGRNGGGKSTLLQILTGTLTPTSGEVKVNGRVSALLELGSGFNPEYSGRDNVILNGLLLGLSREEILNRFTEIESFADIGDAIDRPVKTYSSGMMMRLAFAVQVVCDPDILIIDEALSVGDFFFRQKCYSHIQAMHEKGVTLVFVTHDMNTVSNLCGRAIFMSKGILQVDSDPHQAIRAFLTYNENNDNEISLSPKSEIPDEYDLPNEPFLWKRTNTINPKCGGLLGLSVLNSKGDFVTQVRIGDKLCIRVYYLLDQFQNGELYLQLRNRFDEIIFTTGTYFLDLNYAAASNAIFIAEFDLDMRLGGGEYSIAITLAEPIPPNDVGNIYDQITSIGPISIDGKYREEKALFLGPFGLPTSGSLSVLTSKESSNNAT